MVASSKSIDADPPRQDFRPGDHVRSLASRGSAKRRMFGVMRINPDGTLKLWAHRWGYIPYADPAKWERVKRNEELS